MVKIALWLVRAGAVLMLPLAGLLWSDGALAQLSNCAPGSVCSYVAIQPIDVCSSTGTGCAPFNTLSKVGNSAAATSKTPIGFVDSTTGKDITRTMLNQVGVDIAWSPIRQYNNTTFQTLHVTNSATGTDFTSGDFLQLSQQNTISQGSVPSPTTPVGVPVASQPTVVNMFFVNTLVPPSPGALYGFSWINNNGIAISANTFFPPFPLAPRFDTLAHELGHNLGLDHADVFNYGGTSTPAPGSDLMTVGVNRTEPLSTALALSELGTGDGAGSADQLTTDKTINPSPVTKNSQQDEISLSGLLNPIANSTVTASTPGSGGTTTALVVSDTGGTMTPIVASNSSKPDTSIQFFVSGPADGQTGETLVGLKLTLGKGLHFDPTNPANFSSSAPGNQFVTTFFYDHGNTGDPNCPAPATQCLIIQLSNPGLPEGENLFFTQGIVGAPGQVGSSGKTVLATDIETAGISVTYKFSDGLIITSTLTLVGCCELIGSSQQPDQTVPAQIDPTLFVSINGPGGVPLPCTPTTVPTNAGSPPFCVPPSVSGISDGNPSTDGIPPPSNGG